MDRDTGQPTAISQPARRFVASLWLAACLVAGVARGDVIEGVEFPSALFGIWLGEHLFDTSLREKLLAVC